VYGYARCSVHAVFRICVCTSVFACVGSKIMRLFLVRIHALPVSLQGALLCMALCLCVPICFRVFEKGNAHVLLCCRRHGVISLCPMPCWILLQRFRFNHIASDTKSDFRRASLACFKCPAGAMHGPRAVRTPVRRTN
jgi:hypothetical protein